MNAKQHRAEQIAELGKLYKETLDRGHEIITRFEQGVRAGEAILAAGYRKPRTITTPEELEALPIKAVISGKWLAEKWATPEGDVWFIAGRNMEWFTDDLVMRGGLPATVLDEADQ